MQRGKTTTKEERREVFNNIVEAFGMKYSWLGAQASREMLMSAASYNIQAHSDPPFRFRTHLMLAWERGWFKSTIMRKMADVLGSEMTSTIGKVTDAAMRGSVSGGSFNPPKVLSSDIVISTEFGQTDFSDELLNLFLNQLEEGHTNVALNKIGHLGDNQRKNIENDYSGKINFKENNEYDLKTDFVFWGATYDPSKLSDDALRSRFNVVTPAKPLDPEITKAADNTPDVFTLLDNDTIRKARRFLNSDKSMPTDFRPPDSFYDKYNINPRESRDIQSYMACRNWWGLSTDPDVMRDYIEYLKESRRLSTMEPEERVFDLIFDNPMSYSELKRKTGLGRKELFKIMQRINAQRYDLDESGRQWVIWSGSDIKEEKEESNKGGLSNLA